MACSNALSSVAITAQLGLDRQAALLGSDSFSSFLQKHGPYKSLILRGSGWCGNEAKVQTESLPIVELRAKNRHIDGDLRVPHEGDVRIADVMGKASLNFSGLTKP